MIEDRNVTIIEVKDRTARLEEQLLNVWESVVKATHRFLSEDEIAGIKKYVPRALKEIPCLVVAEDEKSLSKKSVAGYKLRRFHKYHCK